MKRLFKILTIFCFLSLSVHVSFATEPVQNDLSSSKVTLIWGFVRMPPLASINSQGQAEGKLVDLMATISSDSNIDFQPTELPNARAIYTLNRGEIDFAIGLKELVLDAKRFIFSSIPVAQLQLTIVWLEGTPPITSLDELKGQALILLKGYTYGGLREDLIASANTYTDVENHDRAIAALTLERGSYAVVYKLASDFQTDNSSNNKFGQIVLNKLDMFFILDAKVDQAKNLMMRLERSLLKFNQGLPISTDAEPILNQQSLQNQY